MQKIRQVRIAYYRAESVIPLTPPEKKRTRHSLTHKARKNAMPIILNTHRHSNSRAPLFRFPPLPSFSSTLHHYQSSTLFHQAWLSNTLRLSNSITPLFLTSTIRFPPLPSFSSTLHNYQSSTLFHQSWLSNTFPHIYRQVSASSSLLHPPLLPVIHSVPPIMPL